MAESDTDTKKRLVLAVSTDRLHAYIDLPDDDDPSPLTRDEILTLLGESNIEINDAVLDRVEALLQTVTCGGPAERFLIAEGRAPTAGQDENFELDPRFTVRCKQQDGGDAVDFYSFASIVTVDEGEIIGTATPIVEPQAGVDVHGKVIEPMSRPISLTLDRTVRRSDADPTRLLATVPGQIKFDAHTVYIEEFLEVCGNVDFQVCNIDSSVDVKIQGSILDRFEVKSAGSVTVGGAVEAARVCAKNDVTVHRGIIGRGTGHIVAGGQITAKFCHDVHLDARGNINIAREVMSSLIQTDRAFNASAGVVVGGYVYAKEGIDVGVLGSDGDVQTHIVVGIQPTVLERIAKFDESLEALRDLRHRMELKLKPLIGDIKRLAPELKQRVAGMLRKLKLIDTSLTDAETARRSLMAEASAVNEPRVRVIKELFAGTTICVWPIATHIQHSIKGPVTIKKRLQNNVTELVTVSETTGSSAILPSHRLSENELLDVFRTALKREDPLEDEIPE